VKILRVKNTILILSLVLVLSPILAVVGTTPVNNQTVAPRDYDSDFLVPEGTTIYYDITQFTFPEIPNVTLPDFAGNTFYVKVLYVEDGFDFGGGITGKLIWYSMGLIFNEDETITLGTGVDAVNVIIPSGAATPAGLMKAAPHFNDTTYGPAVFFLNNDWNQHVAAFTGMGFTIDINDATTFKASLSSPANGTVVGQWRKSDGICEYLLMDNFSAIDIPNLVVELSLNHVEYRPLAISVGAEVTLYMDTLDIQVAGSGDIGSAIDQYNITESIADFQSTYLNKPMEKFVVTDIRGTFLKCDMFLYNETSDQLELEGSVVFNAFIATIPLYDDPFTYDYYHPTPRAMIGPDWEFIPFFSPWVTPDWDIYGGMLTLMNIVYDYYGDLLDLAGPPADEVVINDIQGGTEMVTKRNFYYFKSAASIDIEINTTSSYGPSIKAAYDEEIHITADYESYLCYHQTGTLAVARTKADLSVDFVNATGSDMGDLTVNIDIKLRNHDYNPPDIIGGGFIPGFTWMLAIPTLLGVAALGLIRRKRA